MSGTTDLTAGFNELVKGSTYLNWARSYPKEDKALRQYVADVAAGKQVPNPLPIAKGTSHTGAGIARIAQGFLAAAPAPTPDPTPGPVPTPTPDPIPPTPTPDPGGKLLWVGDVQDGTLKAFPHQSSVGNHVSVVTDPKGSKRKVIQFAINDADRPYTGAVSPRGDYGSPPLLKPGDDVYLLLQPLIPTGLPLVRPNGMSPPPWFQWCEPYGSPHGGSPPLGMGLDGTSGKNCFSAGVHYKNSSGEHWENAWDGPVVDGEFHKCVIHWKGATDATGFFEIYWDGKLQMLRNGKTRFNLATLMPGVNWDGKEANYLNVNHYRRAAFMPGTVTTWHGMAAIGTTYESVASLPL